jgi:hypothetical protein
MAAVIVAAAAGAPPAHAQYEDPIAKPPPTLERWRSLARDIAAPWPAIQRRSGMLPDYMDERYGSRYGDAMMGYGLVRTGLREGNRAMVRTGLRAVTFATRRPRVQSSFENFAVAATYNLARAHAADYADFRRVRAAWESWMRRSRTTRLHLPIPFGNHWLIDALAVLELRRAGVRSGAGSAASLRLARRLIDVRVPSRVSRGGALLSDPPDEPMAYHGLSIGFYARALQLLGRSASDRSRTTLRRMVATAAQLTAPDGDTAYWGRSLQHVWSPAATAYAAEAAALLPGTSRAERAADRALAERTLARVAREYPIGARGQWIVPSLAQDFAAARPSLEGYAGAPAMSGLALTMLNWTLDGTRSGRSGSRLPADRSLARGFSHGRARFAVVRRGRVWFAVKAAHAERPYARDDLRYAFGLVSAKLRGPGGWFDLVPQRPPLGGRPPVTVGPVLLGRGGRAAGFPDGERLSIGRRGVVEVRGAYRTRGGRVVRRTAWRFSTVDCGVRLSFGARAGERLALTAFFRAGRPELSAKSASDGQQRVTVTPAPSSMSVARRTLASARDAHLHRLEIRVRASRAREVRVTFCGI